MLRNAFSVFLLVSVFSLPESALAQGKQDPQAVGVLLSCLKAAGGTSAISSVQDFSASGSITFSWAGEQVEGSASIKSLGLNDFRLDATISSGTQSWVTGKLTRAFKGVDGSETKIPYWDSVKLGALTFPFVKMNSALSDSAASISYIGLTPVNGAQAHQIRIQKIFSQEDDPDGSLTQWSTVDYFLDETSFLLLKTQDAYHPPQKASETYLHEVYFTNYQSVVGLLVPMSISEQLAGQTTWTLEVKNVTFNTGLGESDFHL